MKAVCVKTCFYLGRKYSPGEEIDAESVPSHFVEKGGERKLPAPTPEEIAESIGMMADDEPASTPLIGGLPSNVGAVHGDNGFLS